MYVNGIVKIEDIATTKRERARRKKSCRYFFIKATSGLAGVRICS